MKTYKLQYNHSLPLLILFAILFFPIALILLMTGCTFVRNEVSYKVHYHGSRFWLGFWTLAFFPITFLLLFINGFSLEKKEGFVVENQKTNVT